jgi:ribulose-phosphate 3-epimerase
VTGNAVKLAPSILTADSAHLGDQVAEAARAGADRIHVDVMDGHFVPNLSMGPPIINSLRRVTHLALEAHLMISNPDFFVDEFVQAGTDSFLIHWEGNNNLSRTVQSSKRWENGSASPLTRRLPRPFWRRSCKISTRCWS